MITSVERPIDLLQSILEECCDLHEQCMDCRRLASCRELWDKASEQSCSKPFTMAHLQYYIDRFEELWQEENTAGNISQQELEEMLL